VWGTPPNDPHLALGLSVSPVIAISRITETLLTMAQIQEIGVTEFDDGEVGYWAHVTSKKAARTSSGRLAVKKMHDVIFDNASDSEEEARETLQQIAEQGDVRRIDSQPRTIETPDGEMVVEFEDRFFTDEEWEQRKAEQRREPTAINTEDNAPEPEYA